jgi:hypothetical protein
MKHSEKHKRGQCATQGLNCTATANLTLSASPEGTRAFRYHWKSPATDYSVGKNKSHHHHSTTVSLPVSVSNLSPTNCVPFLRSGEVFRIARSSLTLSSILKQSCQLDRRQEEEEEEEEKDGNLHLRSSNLSKIHLRQPFLLARRNLHQGLADRFVVEMRHPAVFCVGYRQK